MKHHPQAYEINQLGLFERNLNTMIQRTKSWALSTPNDNDGESVNFMAEFNKGESAKRQAPIDQMHEEAHHSAQRQFHKY
jgi:hypothetical protein